MDRSSNPTPLRRRQKAHSLARGLGWLSIGLGLAELLMPRILARAVGLKGREDLVQAYGLREVATGIGLLKSRNPEPWLWARVAGDVLDVGTLATARPDGRAATENNTLAKLAVLGVAAVDVTCARALGPERRHRRAARDYAKRSGFPRSPQEMRGAALADFRQPVDMQTPALLRPQPAAGTG